MNKFFASIGAVAIGASAAHSAGVEMVDPAKPWSVSASLRGFYDDNYTTAPKGAERDSFGISVSPSIALSLPLEQTTMGLRYTLGANWYQDRENLNSANDPWDFSHELEAFLNHEFSQRYTLDLRDSFVISQEPGLLNDLANPYRTQGDNMRNRAEAHLTAALTRQLSVVLGYQNTWINYENDGGNFLQPSLSGLLDRMEQLGLINLRWQARKDSVVVLGYNYGDVAYDSNETIAIAGSPLGPVTSSYRDNHSHYFYGGIDQNFSKDLLLTLRGGAQHIDYYNDPLSDSGLSPYAQVSLSYSYLPGSSVSVGWTYSHSATDVVAPTAGGQITQDQQASVLYASLNHRFNALLTGFVNGFWQASEFNGGLYDTQGDDFYGIGLGLRYRFNQYLSGEVGYNFDSLSSDLPGRDYDRNRVYLGVNAAY